MYVWACIIYLLVFEIFISEIKIYPCLLHFLQCSAFRKKKFLITWELRNIFILKYLLISFLSLHLVWFWSIFQIESKGLTGLFLSLTKHLHISSLCLQAWILCMYVWMYLFITTSSFQKYVWNSTGEIAFRVPYFGPYQTFPAHLSVSGLEALSETTLCVPHLASCFLVQRPFCG